MKQRYKYKSSEEEFYSDFFEELETRNSTINVGTPETDEACLSLENVHKLTDDMLNPLPLDSDTTLK